MRAGTPALPGKCAGYGAGVRACPADIAPCGKMPARAPALPSPAFGGGGGGAGGPGRAPPYQKRTVRLALPPKSRLPFSAAA